MANQLVTLIKHRQATLTKLRGELEVLERAQTLLAAGTDSSTLAALWERSGGAHVLTYRASKNGKLYRRLVLWVGTWASADELLALKRDLGGTIQLAPRRRWVATGTRARRLCEGIISHVSGRKGERLRELLGTETAGCVSPKVPKARRSAPPKPARTILPKTRLPKPRHPVPIPATPIPPREAPAAPAQEPPMPKPKKDPVPALGVTPPRVPIAPQRGPWRVVDAQGVVLAEGPDRRRAEELAEVLGGSVVPAGQVVK